MNIFNEKVTMYDKVIKEVLDIPFIAYSKINNSTFKSFGRKRKL